jgi:hypothetical protein
MKKLVMVDVLHQFRVRYCVEVEDVIEHALDEVVMREYDPELFKEFSQFPLEPTVILSHREINEEEYLRMFDEDNDYLKSWSKEKKLNFINKIKYEDNNNE